MGEADQMPIRDVAYDAEAAGKLHEADGVRLTVSLGRRNTNTASRVYGLLAGNALLAPDHKAPLWIGNVNGPGRVCYCSLWILVYNRMRILFNR